MAKELSINFEYLESAITDHQEAIDNLYEAVSQVGRAMSELQTTKWDTQASTAYFAQYSNEWLVSVKDHILALETLKNSLINARDEYSHIYDQISTLSDALDV